MTHEEWKRCPSPEEMLRYLDKQGASERKLRLFAVACCRSIWPLLTDARSKKAIESAEQFAEGSLSRDKLAVANVTAQGSATRAARLARRGKRHQAPDDLVGRLRAGIRAAASDVETEATRATAAATAVAFSTFWAQASAEASLLALRNAVSGTPYKDVAGLQTLCGLMRDIFHPFRTAKLDAAWLTDRVVRLAEASYEQRSLPSGHLDPARLSVLADSLEDAGCTDIELLWHLRGSGPHVRGCFAVDLILGRE